MSDFWLRLWSRNWLEQADLDDSDDDDLPARYTGDSKTAATYHDGQEQTA